MKMIRLNDVNMHYRDDGDPGGRPVVFANSLGTDLRVWDALLPLLPTGLRLIRYDKRGHGLTDAGRGEWGMGDLVADVAALMDTLEVTDAVFVGLSIGGLIGQGLAAERPDLVRALALLDTAAKILTPQLWQDRIDAVRSGGIEAMADAILERWFSPTFRRDRPAELAGWRNMLARTTVEGYCGCCQAIAGTDLVDSTVRLRLPAVALVGAVDGSTPPDLVRETAELIPGCGFHVLAGVGHLPCIEKPAEVARLLAEFMAEL